MECQPSWRKGYDKYVKCYQIGFNLKANLRIYYISRIAIIFENLFFEHCTVGIRGYYDRRKLSSI